MSEAGDNKYQHYKFGLFYHNKTDEKLWVPKASGLGWTLNFANKWSYVIIALLLALVVASVVWSSNQKS